MTEADFLDLLNIIEALASRDTVTALELIRKLRTAVVQRLIEAKEVV
jgi:hypothetical protein